MSTDTPRTDAHKALDRAQIVSLCKDKAAGEIIAERIDELERELAAARADSELLNEYETLCRENFVQEHNGEPELLGHFWVTPPVQSTAVRDAIRAAIDAARNGGAK